MPQPWPLTNLKKQSIVQVLTPDIEAMILLAWGQLCPTCRPCIPAACPLSFPPSAMTGAEHLDNNCYMFNNLYTGWSYPLICLLIIHSNFNDPPQHPQLNDYSFFHFQLFIGTLLALLWEVSVRGLWDLNDLWTHRLSLWKHISD